MFMVSRGGFLRFSAWAAALQDFSFVFQLSLSVFWCSLGLRMSFGTETHFSVQL